MPDRLPGYAYVDNAGAREAFEKLWGGVIPSKPGMTTQQMVEAAQSGKLKALYVMGANPLTHFGTLGFGRGNLGLLIVQELFPTDTSRPADIVFPAASAYEKDGTVTNTAGEIQIFAEGCRSYGRAERLRSAADPVAPTGKRGTREGVSLQDAARSV